MSPSELLSVRGLAAAWDGRPVLRDVSFSVAPGELRVLMGPNGSGKTTLLRCLVGLEAPVRGEVRLEGRDVGALPPHRRGIGLLFQEPAILPGRSVAGNIAYGLEVRRWGSEPIDRRVRRVAELVGLESFLARPAEALSGGERQRVALARTLAPGPKLVLLDEPFASVDPVLREALRADFRAALKQEGVASIHVTHDREEGLFLGDRVMMLFGGRLGRAATPRELYDRPASAEVAEFLGLNVLRTGGQLVAVPPEDLEVVPAMQGKERATVTAVGLIGSRIEVYLRTDDGRRLRARLPRTVGEPTPGERVGLGWTHATELREPAEATQVVEPAERPR